MNDSSQTPDTPGVLFVDDEKNILRSLQRLLVDEDFPVFTALSGQEGLDTLRANPSIGLIISDQRMPCMTGAEFLTRSREVAPEALRIMLTGYADIEATIDAINKGGACRYITKPWKEDELIQTIRDALRSYALSKENKRLTAIVAQQNQELKEWNVRLKSRVLLQTSQLREKNQELNKNNHTLNKTYQEMIAAFAGLIELYSKVLRNHSANVAELSLRVARALNLPDDDIEKISVAARLHDIGKLSTPESRAHAQPEELAGYRLQEYMQHAVRGQASIDTIHMLRPVGILIRHHHERFDGNGFPDGLRGEEIPLASRIIAIADFVDRTRLFRNDTGGLRVILPRLQERLGSHFDPALFVLFRQPVQDLYCTDRSRPNQTASLVSAEELREGMVLAQDLLSGTGLLLLSKGTALNKRGIDSIRRFQKLDPGEKTITVWPDE